MSKTMKAAIFRNFNDLQIEEVPMPVIIKPDELIIRVLVCSICGTDMKLSGARGSYGDMTGRIMGHELVGEVCEAGSAVTSLKPGDRVVVNPNSYCGVCDSCRAGFVNHCANMELMGITHPGGFAQYAKSSEKSAFKISKDIPINHAVFAEPLACALNGFGRLDISPGDTALIIGCGPIGLQFAQLARLSGARCICLEPNDFRRGIAEKLGFKSFSPFYPELKEKIAGEWGKRATHCIDAAGGQLPMAIDMAEYCGKILMFAVTSKIAAEASLGQIQSKELAIMGSFIIHDTLPRAVLLIESGVLDLDPIITHVMPLERVNEGIALMRTGEGMEIILTID